MKRLTFMGFRPEEDDIPFEFMGHHAFVAKKTNERFERVDGGEGNIVYDKEKLI